MTISTKIDYDRLVALVEKPIELIAFLKEETGKAGFAQTPTTKWAFDKVATFLEDGWKDSQRYVTLKPEVTFSLDHFGQIVNRTAGGARFTQRRAKLENAPWLGEGEWPTRTDASAYLYFVCCVGPTQG